MLVQNGDKVSISYTGLLDSGTEFVSSQKSGPLKFEVGAFKRISGLNKLVLGMKIGEIKSAIIPSSDAFGEVKDELVIQKKMETLPKGCKIGEIFHDKEKKKWLVVEIDEQKNVATLDANHILAGMDLKFEVEILEIKKKINA